MNLSAAMYQLDRRSARAFTRVHFGYAAGVLALTIAAFRSDLGLSGVAVGVAIAWFAIAGVEDLLVRVTTKAGTLERLLVLSFCLDSIATAAVIGLTGITWFGGAILYASIVVASAALLTRKRVAVIWVTATIALGLVLSLQATGVIPESRFVFATPLRGNWAAGAATAGILAVALLSLGRLAHHLTHVLRQRALRYRALMDTASDLFLVLAHDGCVTHVNRAALAMARCERTDMIADGVGRLLVGEDVPFFQSRLQRAVAGEPQTVMVRAMAYHGVRWLSCTLAPMVPGLRTTSVLAVFRDVTDDRLAADTVRHSEARLRAVFDQAAIAIALLDADGCFVEVNPAVQRLLGYDGVGLVGRQWNAYAPPEDREETSHLIDRLRASDNPNLTVEQRFVRHDGRVLWTLLTFSRVENPNGAPGLIAMLQDITERRALEAQLTWQAFHDPLTNLANRALFQERVERALARRTGAAGTVAVLFLDLDNFKTINDSMGHAAGDQLLFEVGRRLLTATRGCDTVARLGGDEFGVLIDNVRAPADCLRVAERVLEAMLPPVQLDGTEVAVSTSIGIVRDDGNDTADDILRNADVAMYNAKQRGKGRHSVFEPGMHDKAVERLRLQTDLRNAVDNDEITLEFQPIVTLADGLPCGFEALARWVHPEFGAVSPSTFVPLAEETGMIVGLGSKILRLACEHATRWNAMPGLKTPLSVAVNLSGRQLEEVSVVQHVRDALESTGLSPACLTLEITESALVHNSSTMRERLLALKSLGVSLAIDDFGTGYSSLRYIQQFPVDVLKIDRSFVEGLGRSAGTDAALARTIIALGASLSLRTVAEGIETDAQRAMLRELGCEFGQGFLYARPMAPADVGPWLSHAIDLFDTTPSGARIGSDRPVSRHHRPKSVGRPDSALS